MVKNKSGYTQYHVTQVQFLRLSAGILTTNSGQIWNFEKILLEQKLVNKKNALNIFNAQL